MKSTVMKNDVFFRSPGAALLFDLLDFPITKLFQYSVTDYNGFAQTFNYIGFDNYKALFNGGTLGNSISNTLVYTVVSVVAGNLIGLALALLLNMKIRGRASTARSRTFQRCSVQLWSVSSGAMSICRTAG